VSDFLEFVLSRLPRAPARVLEVGCGIEGGVTPALAACGYDVLGIDPDAP
jgi:2-polyprenyl-3-methyl-5-hydroxy-6-metoxy-1,4-benzoquinol methylase